MGRRALPQGREVGRPEQKKALKVGHAAEQDVDREPVFGLRRNATTGAATGACFIRGGRPRSKSIPGSVRPWTA